MSNKRFIYPTYQRLILGILLLAFLVRLPLLNSSFWLDEAAQALESTRPLREQFQLAGDFQPPAYHLLVYLFAAVSHAEWWLRFTSVVASLLTLYFTLKLARNLLGEKASLMAGLLLATSQFFVYYSQELRPYSLAALWGVLSLYLLQSHPRSKWLIVVNALGLLTVYTYIFAIIGQIFMITFHNKSPALSLPKGKSYLLNLVFSFLLCLPWLPSFVTQFQVGAALRAALPGWSQVVSPPVLKALPLLFQKFALGKLDIPNQFPGLLLHAFTTLALIGISLISYKNSKTKPLITYFWAVIFSAFILNLFIPILDPKRFLFILPVFIILVTAGLMQFKKYFVLFFILVFLNIFMLYKFWSTPDLQREPWRQAIAQLEQEATPQSVILFAFTEAFSPWAWYSHGSLKTISTGYLVHQQLNDLDPKLIHVLSQNDLYVFDYLSDLTDPAGLIGEWLTQSGFREVGYRQYPGIGKIRHYQKNNPFAQLIVR